MTWGLDSPGNQPIGSPHRRQRKVIPKCINHNHRDAVALWNLRLLEPVCLECLKNCIKQAKRNRNKK